MNNENKSSDEVFEADVIDSSVIDEGIFNIWKILKKLAS